jgi:hypothetical protein
MSIFLILYFCIATYLSLALGIWREDNYKELREFIPSKYFCGFSQCRSKKFLSGWTSMFFAYSQCRSNRYMWSIRDLNLESMINFSTRVNKVWPNSTQIQATNCRRFIYPIYGSGRTLLLLLRRGNAIYFYFWNKSSPKTRHQESSSHYSTNSYSSTT